MGGAGKYTDPDSAHPPYYFCLPHMLPNMKNAEGKWWCCTKCLDDKLWSEPYRVLMELDYLKALLAISPSDGQLLSILDVALNMTRKMSAFIGHIRINDAHNSLLDGPLIQWRGQEHEPLWNGMDDAMKFLFDTNIRGNPIYKRYRCMMERDHPLLHMPLVTSETIEGILANGIARNPVVRSAEKDQALRTALVTMVVGERSVGAPASKNDIFDVGALTLRESNVERRMLATSTSMPLNVGEEEDDLHLTTEAALFPQIFKRKQEL
jgi:hypothetical protein